MKRCSVCGLTLLTRRVDARTCSPRCRKAASRRSLPDVLTSRARWVRWAVDKRPLTVDGRPASSTDPSTWSSFDVARRSAAGVGFGFVLNGDGVGCYDLDHCVVGGELSDGARAFLASVDAFYVEWSPSGDGVHAWVFAESQPGWKRTVDGVQVEFYTRGRYMTVTGRRL